MPAHPHSHRAGKLPSPVIVLPPNRVRRNYRGGKMLDEWAGDSSGCDSERPEDWIASLTIARNPGLKPIPNEGLSLGRLPDGEVLPLRDLLRQNPEFFLGAHAGFFKEHGNFFLTKLLDSAMRLHLQGHPTADFARRHLKSPWGKFETYVILDVREESEAFLYLGFQRSPGREAWREMVLHQDLVAMRACFDPVPVNRGEVWQIPGGIPHAIGAGLLVLEVMEPSDWVVRCEFELNGIVVPPEARFMGIDPGLALNIFDHRSFSVNEAINAFRVTPRHVSSEGDWWAETLIDARETSHFSITRFKIEREANLPVNGSFAVWIVIDGEGMLENESLPLRRGVKFFSAAALTGLRLSARSGAPLEMLCVRPGQTSR